MQVILDLELFEGGEAWSPRETNKAIHREILLQLNVNIQEYPRMFAHFVKKDNLLEEVELEKNAYGYTLDCGQIRDFGLVQLKFAAIDYSDRTFNDNLIILNTHPELYTPEEVILANADTNAFAVMVSTVQQMALTQDAVDISIDTHNKSAMAHLNQKLGFVREQKDENGYYKTVSLINKDGLPIYVSELIDFDEDTKKYNTLVEKVAKLNSLGEVDVWIENVYRLRYDLESGDLISQELRVEGAE